MSYRSSTIYTGSWSIFTLLSIVVVLVADVVADVGVKVCRYVVGDVVCFLCLPFVDLDD